MSRFAAMPEQQRGRAKKAGFTAVCVRFTASPMSRKDLFDKLFFIF
ncbi:hypothetical protein [Sphingopyxis indica]|nr:hypothetical protein [Sphingopyxis indica]